MCAASGCGKEKDFRLKNMIFLCDLQISVIFFDALPDVGKANAVISRIRLCRLQTEILILNGISHPNMQAGRLGVKFQRDPAIPLFREPEAGLLGVADQIVQQHAQIKILDAQRFWQLSRYRQLDMPGLQLAGTPVEQRVGHRIFGKIFHPGRGVQAAVDLAHICLCRLCLAAGKKVIETGQMSADVMAELPKQPILPQDLVNIGILGLQKLFLEALCLLIAAYCLDEEKKLQPGDVEDQGQGGDREMEHAAERFPINPPQNKEEYFYRSIFEEHFPSQTAAATVPSVPSVACSTAEALAWDQSFANCNDPSGRAVLGVHTTDLKHKI